MFRVFKQLLYFVSSFGKLIQLMETLALPIIKVNICSPKRVVYTSDIFDYKLPIQNLNIWLHFIKPNISHTGYNVFELMYLLTHIISSWIMESIKVVGATLHCRIPEQETYIYI